MTVIVLVVPIKVDAADVVIVAARGIVVRTRADPEDSDMFGTIFPVAVFRTAVIAPAAMVFVPSELCMTVVVPEAICQESFLFILFGVCEE